MRSDILLIELHKGLAVSIVEGLGELEEDVVSSVCCFIALLRGLEVAADLDAYVSLRLSCAEVGASHGVGGIVIVSAYMHYFAFVDIELHAPFVRPINKVVKTFLESCYITGGPDDLPTLSVISKFATNTDVYCLIIQVVNVDNEGEGPEYRALGNP